MRKVSLKAKRGKREMQILGKRREFFFWKHYSKTIHDEDHCWKLHRELKPESFKAKEKGKTIAITEQDLGPDSGDEKIGRAHV